IADYFINNECNIAKSNGAKIKSTSNPNKYESCTGYFLGDMTDELESYDYGNYIESFVSGDPKFYAYIVNWKDKKKLLVQRGGFLLYIIKPVLSTLLSLIIEGTK
ncbi:hypothetical protein ALC53_00300, partial [Atta colombica]